MNSRRRLGGGRRGFTLIEILIALGLFAIGSAALLALFIQNLNTAKLAREEIILAMMYKDIATKNQLAAFTANSRYGRKFPAPDDMAGADPWLVGHPTDMDESIRRYDSTVAKDPSNPTPEEKKRLWANIHMYRSFTFTLENITSLIRAEENYQFTDWDGYGIIYEREIGVDIGSPTGGGPDGNVTDDGWFDFGDPAPSHGVEYDSDGMRYYIKRLKLIIGWELRDRTPGNIKSGKWEKFYFSLFNPDLAKH